MTDGVAWMFLLLLPAGWVLMNRQYGRIHGRRLRWPFVWAAHGALLFSRRLRAWERRG